MRSPMKNRFRLTVGLVLAVQLACGPNTAKNADTADEQAPVLKEILPGANQLNRYLPMLEGKKVGMMGNQTSVVGGRHLIDVLLEHDIDLRFAFAPEHGFRGNIERGEKVSNDVDEGTGLPLYSLYGRNDQADSDRKSVV